VLLSSQWFAFLLLWPNADRGHGSVGALRLRGRQGIVVKDIRGAIDVGHGDVRVEREVWPAESRDGSPIAAGTRVRVTDVRGTRLVVTPLDKSSTGDGTRR
jgi:membrane protein implicated in regulation of membrane protease activity